MNSKNEKNKKIIKFEKKKKEQKKIENNIIKKNPLFILDSFLYLDNKTK